MLNPVVLSSAEYQASFSKKALLNVKTRVSLDAPSCPVPLLRLIGDAVEAAQLILKSTCFLVLRHIPVTRILGIEVSSACVAVRITVMKELTNLFLRNASIS